MISPDAQLPSAEFGKYRLVGAMSCGGMAELFLALQAGLEGFTKVVALKRILPHLAQEPEFVRMFLDEARLAARLDHPSIVRIYELGEVNGQYFTAMEYLPGEDLVKVLHRHHDLKQKVEADIAAAIVMAAADGLHFAHELTGDDGQPLHLVHRDVNPSNIIVTYYGAVKLVDFGIAKAAGNTSDTKAGIIKGKLAYIAPEQASGLPADRRCDVFCLGITFWELLAGKKLFHRSTEVATIAAVLACQVPPIHAVRPEIDPMLAEIVDKALAKDPDQRFQTAGEFHDAIDRYFNTRTLRPGPKQIGSWLEQLFGEKQAQAKRSVAKGSNLQKCISEVMRSVAATSPGVGTPSSTSNPGTMPAVDIEITRAPAPQSGLRKGLIAGAVAIAVALGVGGAWMSTRAAEPAPVKAAAAQQFGTVTITSEPSGAFVFVGGEPTGRMTPTTLMRVPADKPVLVRLELNGFAPARDDIVVKAGESASRSYTLTAMPSAVHLKGVPPDGRVVVDGKDLGPISSVDLMPGRHRIELLADGKAVGSQTVDIQPGAEASLAFGK